MPTRITDPAEIERLKRLMAGLTAQPSAGEESKLLPGPSPAAGLVTDPDKKAHLLGLFGDAPQQQQQPAAPLDKAEDLPWFERAWRDIKSGAVPMGTGILSNVLGEVASSGIPSPLSIRTPGMIPGLISSTALNETLFAGAQKDIKATASREARKIAAWTQDFIRKNDFEGKNFGDKIVQGVASLGAFAAPGIVASLLLGPKGGEAVMALGESAVEQGLVEQELIAVHGVSPAQAHEASRWVFLANLPLNFLLNKGLMKFMPDSEFLKNVKKLGGDRKALAKYIAKTYLTQSGQEGAQEFTQEEISMAAVPGPQDHGQAFESGAIGAITAAIPSTGGAIAAGRAYKNRPLTPMPMEDRPQFEGEMPEGFEAVGQEPPPAPPPPPAAYPDIQQVIDKATGRHVEVPLQRTPAELEQPTFVDEGTPPRVSRMERYTGEPGDGLYLHPDDAYEMLEGYEEFADDPVFHEFVELSRRTLLAEKDSALEPWTAESSALMRTEPYDWEAFSRSRGYSEEEIADHRRWLEVEGELSAKYPDDPDFTFSIVHQLQQEAPSAIQPAPAPQPPSPEQQAPQGNLLDQIKAASVRGAPVASEEIAPVTEEPGASEGGNEKLRSMINDSQVAAAPDLYTENEGGGDLHIAPGMESPAMIRRKKALREAQKRYKDGLKKDNNPLKRHVWQRWIRNIVRKWFNDLYALYDIPTRAFKGVGEDPHKITPTKSAETIMGVSARNAPKHARTMLERGFQDPDNPDMRVRGMNEILQDKRYGLDKNVEDFQLFLPMNRVIELAELERKGLKPKGFVQPKLLVEAEQIVGDARRNYPEWFEAATEITAFENAYLRWMANKIGMSQQLLDTLIDMHKNHVPMNKIQEHAANKTRGKPTEKAGTILLPIGEQDVHAVIQPPIETIYKNVLSMTSIAFQNEAKLAYVALAETAPELAVERAPKFDAIKKKKGALLKAALGESRLEDLLDIGFAFDEKELDALGTLYMLAKEQPEGMIALHDQDRIRYYQVHDEVWDTFKRINQRHAHRLLEWVRITTSTLRAGAVMNPEFGWNNWIRDMFSTSMVSGHNLSVYDVVKGMYSAARKDKRWETFVREGGAFGEITSVEMLSIQKEIDEIASGKNKAQMMIGNIKIAPLEMFKAAKSFVAGDRKAGAKHLKQSAENALQGQIRFFSLLQDGAQLTEMGARIPTYFKRLDHNIKMMEKGEGKYQYWNLHDCRLDAARAARESGIDFQRAGEYARTINQYIPFFNAYFQGADITYRALFASDHKAASWFSAFARITLPSMLLWAANRDEEWYQKAPWWKKNFFWMVRIGETTWLIPKPFDLGLLFGSLFERMADAVYDENPEAMKSFISDIKGTSLPALLPPVIVAPFEWKANYSLFRQGPLVSGIQEGMQAKHQWKDDTSEFAKLVGGATGLSPIKIDATVATMLGGLGKHALKAADWLLFIIDPELQRITPEAHTVGLLPIDLPILKAIIQSEFKGDAYKNTFYEYLNESREVVATYKGLVREDAPVEQIDKLIANHGIWLLAAEGFEEAAKGLSDYATASRKIRVDQSGALTPKKKTRILDALEMKQHRLVKKFVKDFQQKRKEESELIRQNIEKMRDYVMPALINTLEQRRENIESKWPELEKWIEESEKNNGY